MAQRECKRDETERGDIRASPGSKIMSKTLETSDDLARSIINKRVSDITNDEIIKQVQRVLADNFVTEPPVRVDKIALNYVDAVLSVPFPEGFQRVSGYIDFEGDAKQIVVNQLEPTPRQAFTIAHELGHLMLHADLLKDDPDSGILYRRPIGVLNEDLAERQANFFAANLLVPKSFLDRYRNLMPTLDAEAADKLAVVFGVSSEVMRFRFKSLYGTRVK